MPLADLHTHTDRSDGRLSPPGLVEKAARRGLAALAITDHDSSAGYVLALPTARRLGVTLVPGVELSAHTLGGGELHLLGYAFDPADAGLRAHLRRYREERMERAREMVARLSGLGAPVRWERVAALAGQGAVGRPHVARALVEAGYAETPGQAFERYLGDGAPAYVPKGKATPAELIALVHAAGGVCVLAHPADRVTEAEVAALAAEGLDGIETVHPAHDPVLMEHWEQVAARLGLLRTGGSDYHGFRPEDEERFGTFGVPLDQLPFLRRPA